MIMDHENWELPMQRSASAPPGRALARRMVSVLVGRIAFKDQVPTSTWAGLAVILCGSLIIQRGRAR
jgi:hypothetical protein